jgi:phosphate transport system substrate-binding protein
MIVVILVFIVGAVLLLCVTLKANKRAIISVLISVAVGVLSFFSSIFLGILLPIQDTILFSLLAAFNVSLITFLILWNIINTKKVYLTLAVPGICILTAITITAYNSYIHEIPTVSEETYEYRYQPFALNNELAKLDEETNLGFTVFDDLPVLDGATALYPVYASFVQAVYPKDYSNYYRELYRLVLCSRTPVAYENLLEGKADLIFCMAPSDAQKKQFDHRGLNLRLVPIGREAFVFFVNKNNIVDNVTIENIQGIYSGEITNWKELNGANQKIRAFQRPENSGSQTMLEKITGNIPIMEPRREDIASLMGGIINQVAVYRNFPNAIGYSFLFYSTEMVKNEQIKLLSIEGIHPSRETIQDGSYPFSNSFYAIYIDDENKNVNIEFFIEWILSKQGQELVEKTGYTPIQKKK